MKKQNKKSQKIDSCCHSCGKNCFLNPKDYYMLKDEVWREIHPKIAGMLCMDCVEIKLGRPINQNDILICPLTILGNPYTAQILKGVHERKKILLKYRTKTRIKWNGRYRLINQ